MKQCIPRAYILLDTRQSFEKNHNDCRDKKAGVLLWYVTVTSHIRKRDVIRFSDDTFSTISKMLMCLLWFVSYEQKGDSELISWLSPSQSRLFSLKERVASKLTLCTFFK